MDTCHVAEAVIANDGRNLTGEQLTALCEATNCSRGSAETVVWRMQTVLGYPMNKSARGISALDRGVARLYLDHDPRLRGRAGPVS